VSPANSAPQARAEFEKEIEANIAQLYNHPSIVTWVLFNETWGAYDQERLATRIRQQDPSRLLDSHSGPNVHHLAQWMRHLDPAAMSGILAGDFRPLLDELHGNGAYDPASWVGGDMTDIHVYPDPQLPPGYPGRVRVVGEHGGLGVVIDGHVWNDLAGVGYRQLAPDQLSKAYGEMVDRLKGFEARGLSASIYTQPFDVEGEQNGLMTYDREVVKIPLVELARINSELVPRAGNYAAATRGFSAKDADLTPDAQRYASLLSQYRRGRRDPSFLKHFALLARRLGDQSSATQAGNELIDRSPQPYSADLWRFIEAVTGTSADEGFAILRAQSELADSVLGANAAEAKIREVIGREEVDPYTSDKTRSPDWAAIEVRATARYGALGAEKVYGVEMVHCLSQGDWQNFGKYYLSYYETAAGRSEYPIKYLLYMVLEYVTDPRVLEKAIAVAQQSMDSPNSMGALEKDDPVDVDTYANLLYKAGRSEEALRWQERALRLSEGRDQEVVGHLEKMKAGSPTWPVS
jgi:tetratricopeptide (TPR) repeat protein